MLRDGHLDEPFIVCKERFVDTRMAVANGTVTRSGADQGV